MQQSEKKVLNKNLHSAKKGKNDEFYTQLEDIERELKHYKEHFKDKVVYCNCDDPRVSNFFHYFSYNFEKLGLKKLITTCYKNQNRDLFSENNSERAIYLEYTGDKNGDKVPNPEEIGVHELQEDGDFRSQESIELLKQADIVVTNPPFSLFREYVAQLVEYDKKFIIVGHQNALTYKEIFPLIKENKIWLGYGFKGGASHFINTHYEDYATATDRKEGMIRVSGVVWFTNLEIKKRHEDLPLYKYYSHQEYPKYDNYKAIEVSKTKDIPLDYEGIMGVPITFMDKYNVNGGKLDIRPPYQREFVYKDKQREAVIDTVTKCFPLNVMYWAMKEDGSYEVIDGQQRTISISQYINGDFAYMMRYFHNLQKDEQEQILDYKLMVYFCSGSDSEKLEWFKTINIAGEELTEQELRNAVYSGSWVTEAKKYFSKNGCVAYSMANHYMNGAVNRQDYLQTAIDWIAKRDRTTIENYMATHQHEPNAAELWLYFKSVIDWVGVIFPKYRKEMKGIGWGVLYNEFKNDKSLDPKTLEAKISALMQDEDVTSKKGIYEYLLTGREKHLNIRTFTDKQKREAYERQNGICPKCIEPSNHYRLDEMEADHITPWHEGGKTEAGNCQMLCKLHNRMKSGR